MFGITGYGLFLISSILLNLTPGADTIYILGSSISNGRKAGILSALGVSTGCLVHTTLAGLGLSVILAKSALAFNLVKFLGAGYLVYLGIRTLLSRTSVLELNPEKRLAEPKKIYFQGVMTDVLNPKVALFFLAFLPQFINPAQGYGPLPFLLLGLSYTTTGTIWCVTLASISSFAAGQINSKLGVSGVLNRVTGVIYIGLGLNLLREKLS